MLLIDSFSHNGAMFDDTARPWHQPISWGLKSLDMRAQGYSEQIIRKTNKLGSFQHTRHPSFSWMQRHWHISTCHVCTQSQRCVFSILSYLLTTALWPDPANCILWPVSPPSLFCFLLKLRQLYTLSFLQYTHEIISLWLYTGRSCAVSCEPTAMRYKTFNPSIFLGRRQLFWLPLNTLVVLVSTWNLT